MEDFERLYIEYFGDVFRYLRGLTANEALAEELTSETFFKAMKSVKDFRGDCDVRVWLCEIAKNSYFSLLKKRRRLTELNEAELIPDERDIAKMTEDKDTAFRLHKSLHGLPEPYREVFTLRVFGELPFEQIGQLFGKTAHWACVTYHRAKEKLLKDFEN
ncbi:MAG: sigma-70 family RNA polymerase sigma factor [Oscillospiraceae bacterium]|nr:sigma-70 family RNA polymerase sigma factor [Oscillospiraceae bacterium]